MDSDSRVEMNSMGTPWLTTLKNPSSSQALTMSCLASGAERSMNGTSEKNAAEEEAAAAMDDDMEFLMKELEDNCWIDGLDKTTIGFGYGKFLEKKKEKENESFPFSLYFFKETEEEQKGVRDFWKKRDLLEL